jgi:glycosyltransferase involved in cell wall biosynthesis
MTIGKRPLVTVFMAVYNGGKYIGEAIQSTLDQTFTDFELLIVNDGSTDDTLEVVSRFQDPRIRLEENQGNQGIFKTRNRGIAEARGKYFATLDSDDIAYPQRLERQVAYMEAYPDCVVCGGMARIIDAASKHLGNFEPPTGMKALPSYLFFANCFINSTTIIQTDILRELSYRNDFEPAEDYDLFCRLSYVGPIANIEDTVVDYRVHPGNATERKAQAKLNGELLIIRQNMERMGIVTDPEMLRLHHLFISKNFKESGFTLGDIERHLLLLKSQNREKGLYDHRQFEAVLMWQWTITMGYYGLSTTHLIQYIKSPLFRTRYLHKRYIQLFLRKRA